MMPFLQSFKVVLCYKCLVVIGIITFLSPGFSNVDIGVTSDGKTVVCYHPTVDIPYDLTQVRM